MMIASSSILFVLGAVLGSAQAGPLAEAAGTSPNLLGRGIFARQENTIPNVPAACLPSCQPVNVELQNSCPPTDCCTATFTQNYVTCFECVANAAGITDFTSGQQTLHALVEACNARGLPVSEIFFPGQTPSSSPSTTSSGVLTIQTQTIVTSLTATPTDAKPSQVIITSLPATLSVPTPVVPTTTSQSGAVANVMRGGMGGVAAWVVPFVALGLGSVLL